MYLAPAPAALAQNECGPGPTVECADTNYPDGITYDSAVDLSVTATDGPTTAEANGVNLTGTGSASIVWDSSIGDRPVITHPIFDDKFGPANFFGGDMTDGPVLDVLTDSGSIDIRTRGIEGAADTVTHGIRARSTGGGSILINDRYEAAFGETEVHIRATDPASGVAGIEAASSGGNGDVEILFGTGGGDGGSPGAVEGSQYGILASTEGSGDLTIRGDTRRGGGLDGDHQARFSEVNATGGGAIAGIRATTGTGTLDILADADGGAGSGVIVDAGGDVVFTGEVSGDQYGIDLLNVAAGTTSTLNIAGGSGGIALARAQGDGAVVVNMTSQFGLANLGVIEKVGTVGRHRFENLNFDFNGLADTAQVNITGEAVWRVQDLSTTVSDNNFNVFIRETGGLNAGLDPSTQPDEVEQFQGAVVIDFEGADRLLVNEGFIAIGPDLQQAEVRLEGLAEFRHSGRILMGSSPSQAINFIGEPRQFLGNGDLFTNRTDSRADDVLAVPDANWVGEGGEIWIDIDFSSGQSQNSCERNADGDLPAADCLELHGATTSGVTYLTLADPLAFDRGRLVEGQEIVLVDVSGGDSAQGHFVIGPNTPSYSPLFGGSWDRGLFQYVVGYNQDTQQHILSGMPNHSAYQQAQLAATAHDLWRTSTATSLDRQADLRDRGADETGGLWLRVSNETADRDVINTERVGTEDFPFDNSFSRDSYALTFGLDFLTGGSGDSAWMLGFMGGYANADVEYSASVNSAELNGWSLGTYAGYTAGGLWVDAAVNLNELTLRQHIPGLNLIPQETLVSNDLRSVGAQVDAGWRFDLTRAIFVEPLASLSYVSTSFDTLDIKPDDPARPGLALEWNDPTSLRAGLGGRVGTNYDLGFMRGQLSLAAKVWNESDGESVVSIHNNAYPDDPDVEAKDNFDDTVTEVTLGASVRSPGNAVSGFINLGGATASDYDAFTAKLGVRYQW